MKKKELSYIDSVHRDGTIWNLSVMVLLLAFPLTVAIVLVRLRTGKPWAWACWQRLLCTGR
jgi:hypothetical protein